MSQHPPELIAAARELLDWVRIVSDQADNRYIIGWVIVSYDPVTDDWDARGLFGDPREASREAKARNEFLTGEGEPNDHQLILPVFDFWSKAKTMDAYKCDGCKQYKDGPAILTIERTDGLATMADDDKLHACSWACVETIGRAQVVTREERAFGRSDDAGR